MRRFQVRDLLGMGQSISLTAPLAGWLVEETDMPYFNWKSWRLDAGLIIEPVDQTLRAPCDGVVTRMHHDRLDLTMTLANGAELLIGGGISQHCLGGDRFVPHVSAGQWVWAGDPLVSFGMDDFARKTRGLLISVSVPGEAFRMSPVVAGRPITYGEPLGSVRPNRMARAACCFDYG